jgi:hypothetical protein
MGTGFVNSAVVIKHLTTPATRTGHGQIYPKSDWYLYYKDGAGNERKIDAGYRYKYLNIPWKELINIDSCTEVLSGTFAGDKWIGGLYLTDPKTSFAVMFNLPPDYDGKSDVLVDLYIEQTDGSGFPAETGVFSVNVCRYKAANALAYREQSPDPAVITKTQTGYFELLKTTVVIDWDVSSNVVLPDDWFYMQFTLEQASIPYPDLTSGYVPGIVVKYRV